MCGLTGFIDLQRRLAVARLAGIAQSMTDSIAHRGPDDAATWVDAEAAWRSASAGWRSSTCRPWDASPCLPPPADTSSSTTARSTMRRSCAASSRPRACAVPRPLRHRGDAGRLRALGRRRATLDRIAGMFAIALWDRHEPQPVARPRPAGQEAALLRQDRRHLLLRLAAQELLSSSRTGGPRSIATASPPSCALAMCPRRARSSGVWPASARASASRCAAARWSARRLYWDARARAAAALAEPMDDLSDEEAVARFEALLSGAVRAAAGVRRAARRLPVGRRRQLGRRRPDAGQSGTARVKTFSIGFDESAYDESRHARGGGGAPGHRASRAAA